MIPDDLDELLALVEARRSILERAVVQVEQELAAGRTGYGAYSKARMIENECRKLAEVAQARIEAALAEL
ncbi:hypothetical protein [Sphingomonas phyllosphaerae]|uniref:hypothetical protein n=1 Tax=Sphingomonas phyllosphaerae TaxID=257003 RepID=UPI0012DEE0C2|nr:hypothetical protein [Sphingomonas phyllosphaerae]